jgi:hypothetical protein
MPNSSTEAARTAWLVPPGRVAGSAVDGGPDQRTREGKRQDEHAA